VTGVFYLSSIFLFVRKKGTKDRSEILVEESELLSNVMTSGEASVFSRDAETKTPSLRDGKEAHMSKPKI
jgi:hypothetical protein